MVVLDETREKLMTRRRCFKSREIECNKANNVEPVVENLKYKIDLKIGN